MDDRLRNLKGSPSRDIFKQMHKQKTDAWHYAFDQDLTLVAKRPPGIVAYLDYKKQDDEITFAEAIGYNEEMKTAPVYIVQGDDPEYGPFEIFEYRGGDWRPFPPVCQLDPICLCRDWDEYNEWEQTLLNTYGQKAGNNG